MRNPFHAAHMRQNARAWNSQALDLIQRYHATGVLDALTAAIKLLRDAAAALPDGDGDQLVALGNLGNALRDLYGRTQDVPTLTEAVGMMRRVVAATPPGAPDEAARLSNLGSALQTLFERSGDPAALTEAVQVGRRAADLAPDASRDKITMIFNLGIALKTEFGLTGDVGTLTEAVNLLRRAADAAPDTPQGRARVANLAAALRGLYERTGDLATLQEAVATARRAVGTAQAAIPVHDPDPTQAVPLNSLASALYALYLRVGDQETLTQASWAARAAVKATPDGDVNLAGRLSNLAICTEALFERTGQLDLQTEAVSAARGAVEKTPQGSPVRPGRLSNLGTALQTLFERTGQLDALDEAVATLRDAAREVPDGSTSQPMILSNLAIADIAWYYRTGEADALAEAIRVSRQAAGAAVDGGPQQALCRTTLGSALRAEFLRTGDARLLAEARDIFAGAAASTAARLIDRIKACLGWGDVSMRAGRPDDALAGLEAAVELLPQLVPRRLSRVDREYGLARISGLGAQAAAAAIAARAPTRAVELLEQARGLLLAETLDARRDLTDLRAHAPDLAAEFDRLREAFDAADRASLARLEPTADDALLADPSPQEQMRHDALLRLAELRDTIAGQWQSLLARIRAQPGFERFLLPAPIAEIQRQAVDGPIVFVMTSPWRCDAIILTADPARPATVVPLPGLTEEAALNQARQFAAARDRAAAGRLTQRRQAQRDLNGILAWLWTAVAEPVLTGLGMTGPPANGSSWPRLWWCPVGVMTQLPLHAAGQHDERQPSDGSSVMDRAVSSYTATVRALAYGRQGASQSTPTDSQPTLLVAMAETPGAPTLAWVPDLATLLTSLLPGTCTLTGEQATREAVLSRLPGYPIAHFACHGLSDMAEPDASRLLLYDYVNAPLTVTEIARLQLAHANLAYLSACSTTSTAEVLVDEAIHITAAFQIAGYRHVIGTLAPVGDEAAATTDAAFYRQITSNGSSLPQVDCAAQGLHDTLRQLRDNYPLLTTRWALYIHAGI